MKKNTLQEIIKIITKPVADDEKHVFGADHPLVNFSSEEFNTEDDAKTLINAIEKDELTNDKLIFQIIYFLFETCPSDLKRNDAEDPRITLFRRLFQNKEKRFILSYVLRNRYNDSIKKDILKDLIEQHFFESGRIVEMFSTESLQEKIRRIIWEAEKKLLKALEDIKI